MEREGLEPTRDEKVEFILWEMHNDSLFHFTDSCSYWWGNDNKDYREYHLIKDLLVEHDIIKLWGSSGEFASLTPKGVELLETGGWRQFLQAQSEEKKKKEARERLNFEKTTVDLELAKRTLKDYPYTKWMARIGFLLSVALGIIELVKFLKGSDWGWLNSSPYRYSQF
jgi:hypothetical protein